MSFHISLWLEEKGLFGKTLHDPSGVEAGTALRCGKTPQLNGFPKNPRRQTNKRNWTKMVGWVDRARQKVEICP